MLLDGRRQERVLVARGRCDGWRPRIPSLASMVFQQMPHPLIRHPTFPIPGSPLGCELARASRPDPLRRDPLQSSEPRPGRRCQARQSSSLPLWRVECDWGFVAGQPSWITQAWRFEGLTHVLLLWPPGGRHPSSYSRQHSLCCGSVALRCVCGMFPRPDAGWGSLLVGLCRSSVAT